MSESMKEVATFQSYEEAAVAAAVLEAEGIDSFIPDVGAFTMRGHLAASSGGYQLMVAEADLDAARNALSGR